MADTRRTLPTLSTHGQDARPAAGAEQDFSQGARRASTNGASNSEAAAVIEAQLAGQTNRRRGLKGGAPVLDAAKAAYLDAEWRGPDDRRLPAGIIKSVKL